MKKIFVLSLLGILLSGSIVFASDSMYKKSGSKPSYVNNYRPSNKSPEYSSKNTQSYLDQFNEMQKELENMEKEQQKKIAFYKNNIRHCIKGQIEDYRVLGFQDNKCVIYEKVKNNYKCEFPKTVLQEYSQSLIDTETLSEVEVFSKAIDKQVTMFVTYCNRVE